MQKRDSAGSSVARRYRRRVNAVRGVRAGEPSDIPIEIDRAQYTGWKSAIQSPRAQGQGSSLPLNAEETMSKVSHRIDEPHDDARSVASYMAAKSPVLDLFPTDIKPDGTYPTTHEYPSYSLGLPTDEVSSVPRLIPTSQSYTLPPLSIESITSLVRPARLPETVPMGLWESTFAHQVSLARDETCPKWHAIVRSRNVLLNWDRSTATVVRFPVSDQSATMASTIPSWVVSQEPMLDFDLTVEVQAGWKGVGVIREPASLIVGMSTSCQTAPPVSVAMSCEVSLDDSDDSAPVVLDINVRLFSVADPSVSAVVDRDAPRRERAKKREASPLVYMAVFLDGNILMARPCMMRTADVACIYPTIGMVGRLSRVCISSPSMPANDSQWALIKDCVSRTSPVTKIVASRDRRAKIERESQRVTADAAKTRNDSNNAQIPGDQVSERTESDVMAPARRMKSGSNSASETSSVRLGNEQAPKQRSLAATHLEAKRRPLMLESNRSTPEMNRQSRKLSHSIMSKLFGGASSGEEDS